jgi:hypothetical protein
MMDEKWLKEWQQLCELASREQDHQKLKVLVREIIRMYDEKSKKIKPLDD